MSVDGYHEITSTFVEDHRPHEVIGPGVGVQVGSYVAAADEIFARYPEVRHLTFNARMSGEASFSRITFRADA